MYRTILVAVDASDFSARAVEQAAALARASSSSLILMHAYPSAANLVGASDYDIAVDKRRKAGQEVLDNVHAKLAKSELAVQQDLREGPEGEAVVQAAEDHKADLIVLGSRGLGAMAGAVLGSVSRQVSSDAHCAVLIVR